MDDIIRMKKSTKSYKIRRQIKLPWMRLRLSPFKKVHCVQAWISSAFSRFFRIMGWGVESMSSKLANRLQRISRDLLVLEPFNHDPLDLWKSNAVSLWLLKSMAFSCKKWQQKEPSPSAVATSWCEVAKWKRPSGQRVSGRIIFDAYLMIFARLFGEKIRNCNFPDPISWQASQRTSSRRDVIWEYAWC